MRLPSSEDGHEGSMRESGEPGSIFKCWKKQSLGVLPEKDLRVGGGIASSFTVED